MAPWPHKVLRGCRTKHRYPSPGRADAGARSLERKDAHEGKPRIPVNAYFCCRCRGWHIGHGRLRVK